MTITVSRQTPAAGRTRRPLRWRLRTAVAAVAALLGVLTVALPAEAMTTVRSAGWIPVNGVWVEAVGWNSWGGPGNVSGNGTLVVDAAGGSQFAGRVSNAYVAGRHIRYRCTITYGPGDRLTWSTPRYWIAGGTSKSWSTGRRTDEPRVQVRWAEIASTGRASCEVAVG